MVEDTQLLALQRANEQVLGDELRAINDRFRVGELTRTRRGAGRGGAGAGDRNAGDGRRASCQTARATFVREVGVEPPLDLADPQPLKLPVKSDKEAGGSGDRQ